MPVKIAPREHSKTLIDRAIRKALARTSGKPRRFFLQWLGEIRGRSDILKPARFRGPIDSAWLDAILGGLFALTQHYKDWLRPLETWTPVGSTPIALFSTLAHHLLADYPVPPVMLSAWFVSNNWSARRQQQWFKRAGKGMSLREVGFPIALTRRMAHEFAHAPHHYPVEFALRWAQVRGLDGTDELARTVAATRLGETFRNDDFWISLIHFLINHPKIKMSQVDLIVAYLDAQKFEDQSVIIGESIEVSLDPPQPDLSLKGWSADSLLRRVDEWKSLQKVEAKRVLIGWDRSAIGEFFGRDEQGRIWTISELLNSNELAAEGVAMDHCVATYTSWCVKRLATIWSVKLEGAGGPERVATVELNPASRAIVQTKAKSNEDPDEDCQQIVKQWAAQQSLTFED